MIEGLARHLLGRKVAEFALQARATARAALRRLHPLLEARDPEVAELHLAVDRQVNVGWRDVAMHDVQGVALVIVRRVHRGERAGHAQGDERGEPRREFALFGIGPPEQPV